MFSRREKTDASFPGVEAGTCPEDEAAGSVPGIGILLTNQDHYRPPIERRIACQLDIAELTGVDNDSLNCLEAIKKRLIYRRLETHHITSPILFHIVEQTIEAARDRLISLIYPTRAEAEADPEFQKVIHEASWRIRMVIDDWTQIIQAYPEVQRDPRFLPFLLFYLRRKNVTVLIIDTHPGDPETVKGIERVRDLPALVDRRLYAWRLPFFGSERVALRGATVERVTPRVRLRVAASQS